MALTPEEERELAELEAAERAKPQRAQGGLTPDEEAELAQLEAADVERSGAGLDIDLDKDEAGDIALKAGLRGLDIAGSPVRGALAGLGEQLTGLDLVKEGETQAALTGNFPSSDVILKRAGVPEGGSISDIPQLEGVFKDPKTAGTFDLEKGGMLDFTARGTGGFAADVATDPLTYLSLGAAPVLKKALGKSLKRGAGKATKEIAETLAKSTPTLPRGASVVDELAPSLRAPSKEEVALVLKEAGEKPTQGLVKKVALETLNVAKDPVKWLTDNVGKATHASGFSKIDTILETEKGVGKLSEVLNKRKISGTVKGIDKKLDKLNNVLDKERSALYRQVNDAGVGVDLEGVVKQMRTELDELTRLPGNKNVKQAMTDLLDEYDQFGKVIDINDASAIKSELYEKLPETAFDQHGKLNNVGKKLFKKMSLALKNAIEESGNAAKPGLGDQIAKVNKEWQTVLTARKPLLREVRTTANRKFPTQVDAMAAVLAPQAFAAKNVARGLGTTSVRTRLGRGLQQAPVAPAIRGGILTGTRGLPNEDN